MPRMGSLYIFTIAHHSLPGVVIKTDGAPKKALRLAVVTSLMGGMSVKVASATYHIAESTVQVWKRMWREANTNEP